MKTSVFEKIIGAKMERTTNGIYKFTGVAVAAMSEVNAWYELRHGAVLERDGYRFHLIFADNGHHFKYDGPGSAYECVNLFVESIEDEESWLHSCLICWSTKDVKKYLRRFKNIALSAPVSEIEETRQKEKSDYTWRYMKVVGENVYSIKGLKELAAEKVA